MPAKRNVTKETSQAIFLYTRGNGRAKLFQTSGGRETTLLSGSQDDKKNTYQANTFCALALQVFQKHPFFA